MANREDGCTGRFWEGRFKCQALLDEQAVLSCMAYVDLNPVRAGMCETLRDSEHTSVRYRIESTQSAIGKALGRSLQDQALKPVAGLDADALSDLTESSYIKLVRWTGRKFVGVLVFLCFSIRPFRRRHLAVSSRVCA